MVTDVYKEITTEDYQRLLERLDDRSFKAQDLDCFLLIEYNNQLSMYVYIAIDNTTGDLWTEEFTDLEQAIKYLKGELEVSEIEAIYNGRNRWQKKFKKQQDTIIKSYQSLIEAYKKIDNGLNIINQKELERQVAEGMSDILEAKNTLKELTNMKTYSIEIKEVLSRVVEVEATSAEEAKDIVFEQYKKEEIILDDGDYDGVPNIREIQ